MLQYQESLSVVQVMLVGRPDGVRPGGRDSTLQLLAARFDESAGQPANGSVSPQEWMELDREFTQFQQRRKAALVGASESQARGDLDTASTLYRTASEDAQHSLAIIAFARRRHPSQQLSAAQTALIPTLTAQKWVAHVNRRMVAGNRQDALDCIRRGVVEVTTLLQQLGEADPSSNACVRDMKIVERTIEQASESPSPIINPVPVQN
ncbi:MAG: hypothetical protein GXP29_12245 [Planctomycetes bacterium]|nr:hypothetical protein [Planctomycetota bacterium]